MRRMVRLILAPIVLLTALDAQAAPAILAGHWEGRVTYRGDDWPIRLDISETDGTPAATIDLPTLVMAWEPVPIRAEAGGAIVELPFGIGAMRLEPDGDVIDAADRSGKQTVRLVLNRTDPPGIIAEPLKFGDKSGVMAGTLYRPATAESVAAVVLLHGSGKPLRSDWAYRSWADFYVRRGVAALVYDRRGSGESAPMPESGDTGFERLASDALGAVRFLAATPGIDPRRIGLAGGSQAGWIATLAASRSKEVSFLILTSAAAVTPADQEIQSVTHRMRADGLDEETIQDAVAYLRLYFHVARTGRDFGRLKSEAREAAGAKWGDYVGRPERRENLAWWSRHLGVSPAAILPQVTVPVLALYGGADTVVPPYENGPLFEHLIRSGGNGDVTMRILPGADHRLELPMGRVENGQWKWAAIAPDALATIEAWLKTHRLSG